MVQFVSCWFSARIWSPVTDMQSITIPCWVPYWRLTPILDNVFSLVYIPVAVCLRGLHPHTDCSRQQGTLLLVTKCLDRSSGEPNDVVYGVDSIYRQVSNIRRTLVGNWIADHSDVVGASPVGAAPTTSSFSIKHLASTYGAKTTASRDEKHLSFDIWCGLY